MSSQIEQDAIAILNTLSEISETENDPINRHYGVYGNELEERLPIGPNRINDAVELLSDQGYIQRELGFGSSPHDFVLVTLASSGRVASQRAMAANDAQSPTNNLVYDVFLSHSGLDDDLARDIQELLSANGIKVFCTPDSIPSGKWEPQIEEALEHSSEIWVLLTPNALNASVWIHQEFGCFYGFNRQSDSDGHRSHYIFEEGPSHPGLYDQLQETSVKNWATPRRQRK